jgi:hypothetical protein
MKAFIGVNVRVLAIPEGNQSYMKKSVPVTFKNLISFEDYSSFWKIFLLDRFSHIFVIHLSKASTNLGSLWSSVLWPLGQADSTFHKNQKVLMNRLCTKQSNIGLAE